MSLELSLLSSFPSCLLLKQGLLVQFDRVYLSFHVMVLCEVGLEFRVVSEGYRAAVALVARRMLSLRLVV